MTDSEKSIRQMVRDGDIKDPNPFPTVGEMLRNRETEGKKWYWVQENPYVNITSMVLNSHLPLMERQHAKVVPIEYYVDNQSDPAIHIVYKVSFWIGYMFGFVEKTGEPIIERVVKIASPRLQEVDLARPVIADMKLEKRGKGRYFFKDSSGGLLELGYNELPFLKRYYQVDVAEDNNITIRESAPMVWEYTIFEYYPSGAIQRITKIMRGRDMDQPDEYKHLPSYGMVVAEYTDHYNKPKLINRTDYTPLYDVNHPYWLPNILRD